MKDFIHTLRNRYAGMVQNRPMDSEQAREAADKLNALRLAESVLKKIALNEEYPKHTTHIGILGPTQSGKSTLVNLLFQNEAAGVSALAGFTVHAQGFVAQEAAMQEHHSGALFDDFELIPQAELQHEQYKQYAVELVPGGQALANDLNQSVIWDSPDFDSIESGSYRSAVLRVAAIADICILMVSKDKYADKSVWDMLALLQPLQKPLIVCINKLNEPDTDVVINSFLQRYADNISATDPPVVMSLPYIKGLSKHAAQMSADYQHKLFEHISTALHHSNRDNQRAGAYRFIRQHWDGWLAPVLAEQSAATQWQDTVDAAIASGMQRYREGYIDHPQKYDTFNRALAELLTLLEIPGLAGTLGKTRQIVTWPVKKLLQLGKSVVEQTPASSYVAPELEDDVLRQAAQHVLTQLTDAILDAEQDNDSLAHWWSSLSRSLNREQSRLLQDFEQNRESYQQAFKPQIEAAARKLYANLQEQPAMLNSLRAARVSTDAAAVVLAVHSGGLAASDLVLAPAMLSLTTMLTESALGKYMDGVRNDLKTQQIELVREQLFENVLQDFLYTLPQANGDSSGLLSIDEIEVARAQQQLETEVDEH